MISSISSHGVKVNEAKKGSQEGTELIKSAGKASMWGTAAIGTLELLSETDMIYNSPKYVERIINDSEKYLISIGKKYKGNAEKIGEIFGQVSKYTEARLKTVREFAQNGRVNFKRIGKAAAAGFVVVGSAYLIYRGIKSLINKKHAKTEA